MAFNFPASANVGDIYSSGSFSFQFDGVAWNYVNTTAVLAFNQANAAYTKANSAAQITFGTVVANGTNIIATSNNDTLTIIANANVSIVGNSSTKNVTFDLTDTTVVAATYGNTNIVPVFTVDSKGRLTSVTNTAINTTIASAAFDKANQQANLSFTTIVANGTSLVADSNADTLTIRTTGNVAITADASGDNMTFDLTTTGVTAATYGSSTIVPVVVVDSRGRLTSVTNTTIDTTIATAAFAKANQQANLSFTTVVANGTSLVADSNADTLTIRTTGNVAITADATGDNMTFDLTTTGVTAGKYGSGTVIPVITVDSRGRVTSMGTSSIAAVLNTGDTMTGNLVMSAANIAFATATNTGIYWSGTAFVHSTAANTLIFGTSSVERLRIDSSGNMNIATGLYVTGTVSDAQANVLSQTLTDAAAISWDGSLGRIATVTLGGARSLSNATNIRVGTYVLRVQQNTTSGNSTLTFGRQYKFTANVAPTLTASANAIDIFSFVSDGTNMYGAMIPDVRS
jgi:hypothetical protein